MRNWENEYNITVDEITDFINKNSDNVEELNDLGLRFRYLMMKAYKQTGSRLVVLVDEYDKPLLEVMEQPD